MLKWFVGLWLKWAALYKKAIQKITSVVSVAWWFSFYLIEIKSIKYTNIRIKRSCLIKRLVGLKTSGYGVGEVLDFKHSFITHSLPWHFSYQAICCCLLFIVMNKLEGIMRSVYLSDQMYQHFSSFVGWINHVIAVEMVVYPLIFNLANWLSDSHL